MESVVQRCYWGHCEVWSVVGGLSMVIWRDRNVDGLQPGLGEGGASVGWGTLRVRGALGHNQVGNEIIQYMRILS